MCAFLYLTAFAKIVAENIYIDNRGQENRPLVSGILQLSGREAVKLMSYSYNSYFIFGITVPAVIAIIALVAAVFVVLHFSKTKAGPFTKASPIIAFLLICLLMISLMYQSLPFLEHLPSEKRMPPTEDVIQIKTIENASFFPLYFDNEGKTFQTAKIITSERGIFYCVNATRLQAGNYVQLSFLPYSRSVLAAKAVTEAYAQEYWENHSEPPTAIGNNEYQENGYEGKIIFTVFFAIVAKVVLIELFITPLSNILSEKDKNTNGLIKPRLFGILEKGYSEAVFISATVFSFGTGSALLGTIFLCLALGYAYYMLEFFTSSATYANGQLFYKSISTKLTVKRNQIVKIGWTNPKNISGFVLTVYLEGAKTLHFPQVDFVGLDGLAKWVNEQGEGDGCPISS